MLKNKTSGTVPLGQVLVFLTKANIKNSLPVLDGASSAASGEAQDFGIINYLNAYEEKVVFIKDFPVYSNIAGPLNFGENYVTQAMILAPDGPYQWKPGYNASLFKQETIKLPSLAFVKNYDFNMIFAEGRWLNNN